jgi:hypothetical protein
MTMSAERAKMEEELFAAEHARRAAITRGDMAAIESFLADTFYYAHISGLAEEREAYLKRTAANPGLIRSTSSSDLAIQPRPGYVLMTGKSAIETAQMTIHTLFLAVWERTAGGWKISAYASTPLPKE